MLVLADPAITSAADLDRVPWILALLAGAGVVPDQADRWNEQACQNGGLGSITLEHLIEKLWET